MPVSLLLLKYGSQKDGEGFVVSLEISVGKMTCNLYFGNKQNLRIISRDKIILEVAQYLRLLTAFSEDKSLFPRIHMGYLTTAYNSSSRVSKAPACMYTHKHKNFLKISFYMS